MRQYYNSQKQAKQTAINNINSFKIKLKHINEDVPKGTFEELFWTMYLEQLINKCDEVSSNIKQTII